MKEIRLGRSGEVALVDGGDYDLVSQYPWFRVECGKVKKKVYVHRRWYYFTDEGVRRQKTQLMHNLIMDAMGIDHIDGDGLNNQRSNLRICSQKDNARYQSKKQNTNNLYKGVSFRPAQNNYRAYITPDGKQIHLGIFKDPVEAAMAYDRAALEIFGEFAYLNFPKNESGV